MNAIAPFILCRSCLHSADVQFQPGFDTRPGHWIITCRQPECDLYRFTFTGDDYAAEDLTAYGAVDAVDAQAEALAAAYRGGDAASVIGLRLDVRDRLGHDALVRLDNRALALVCRATLSVKT